MTEAYIVYSTGGYWSRDTIEEIYEDWENANPGVKRKWKDNPEEDGIYYTPDLEAFEAERGLSWNKWQRKFKEESS